jgi:mannosylglycerate hydrolase
MQTVHLVPHTHWDREWYFTAAQSKALLLETLAAVLDELESGSLPCFVLDGQTSLLEDYLGFAPEDRDRIASLVAAGRLRIGPWYTQTDQCVVGGESIVRNLLYGIRDARAFGGHMAVGYVPDSFGQTAQLPQILAGFGISRCVFGRGLWEGVSARSEFEWAAADGSRVTTAVLLGGYAGVKGMPEGDDMPQRRLAQIDGHAQFMRRFNTTDHTLVMAGNDQQPWDPRLPAVLEAANQRQQAVRYRLGDLESFFEVLDRDASLATVRGEMLAGKYGRIHRGIYSTRYDIKKANADAENLIARHLEPVLCIGWALGMRYPHGLLEKAWKQLFKSQAHDSIGCCNSDEVNRVVLQRLQAAQQTCRQALELRMRQIAQQIRPGRDGEKLVVFNTLPAVRSTLVEAVLVATSEHAEDLRLRDEHGRACAFQSLGAEAVPLSQLVQDLEAALEPGESGDPLLYRHRLLVDAGELPALGYKTLYLQTGPGAKPCRAEAVDGAAAIGNEHLRVTVGADGTLALAELAGGRTLDGLLELVDGGDDGDSYDFSPPREDWRISTRGQRPRIQVKQGPLRSTMTLDYELVLPADLAARASGAAEVTMPVRVKLGLDRGSDRLDVAVELDNTVRDHRLQAVFRTGLGPDVSYADQPFGMLERPSRPPELREWRTAKWTSKPVPLYPMQACVALADGTHSLALLTDGIREYEIDEAEPGTVALTLFRSVGRMGKPDLEYRPGRLSGMPLATADAQLQGPLAFRFAIRLFAGRPQQAAGDAARYLAAPLAFHLGRHHKFSINRGPRDLPPDFSLAALHGPLVVAAVKKAEDRDACLVRAFNPDAQAVSGARLEAVAVPPDDAVVRAVNLNEEPLGTAVLDGGRWAGPIAPQQIVTFMLEREGPAA